MPPGKITRFFKCESLHCVENPSWKNADHQAEAQACPCCEIEAKPYRIVCTGRLYGNFRCKGTQKSCGKYWTSAYAFCGRWQQCSRCYEKVEPYSLRELDKKKGNGPPKPHCHVFCQVCKDLKSQGILTGCQNYFEEAEMDLNKKEEKSAAKKNNGHIQQSRQNAKNIELEQNGQLRRKYFDRRKAIRDFEKFHTKNLRLHEQEKSKQKTEIKEVPAKVVKKKKKSQTNKDESKSKIASSEIKIEKADLGIETEKDPGERIPAPDIEQKKKSKRKKKRKSKSAESEKGPGDKQKTATGMRFPFSKKLEYKVEKYEENTDKAKFLNEIALKMITFRMKNKLTISGAGDQM